MKVKGCEGEIEGDEEMDLMLKSKAEVGNKRSRRVNDITKKC